ncbi:hypothetical protein V6Z12_A10G053400 [Gossypium hirsutum]
MTSRLTMSSSKPLLYFCLVVLLSCGQSINAQTNATTHPPEDRLRDLGHPLPRFSGHKHGWLLLLHLPPAKRKQISTIKWV